MDILWEEIEKKEKKAVEKKNEKGSFKKRRGRKDGGKGKASKVWTLRGTTVSSPRSRGKKPVHSSLNVRASVMD